MDRHQDSSTRRTWRCDGCRALLGIEQEGKLHLKYKEAQYVVTGTAVAVCRRCAHLNRITCSPGPHRGEAVPSHSK